MQLDCMSKLLPAAWARVSDIQLLQALWCFSHISLLPSPSGRQHSHFHTKLPLHFCWKLTPWFFFQQFLNFPPLRKKKKKNRISLSLSRVGVRREVQAVDKTRWVLQTSWDEGVPFRQAEIKLLSFGLEKIDRKMPSCMLEISTFLQEKVRRWFFFYFVFFSFYTSNNLWRVGEGAWG